MADVGNGERFRPWYGARRSKKLCRPAYVITMTPGCLSQSYARGVQEIETL